MAQDVCITNHAMLLRAAQEFEELLASSKASGKVFVLFNALTWCRPCKGMERPVQRLAEQYKATVRGVHCSRKWRTLLTDH
jgi:thiol-disulfide isomerase/thioredoxin